jgi:solute:Na+ symporter, SSS family
VLIWFVIAYLMVSIGIGLVAATRVKNTKDYAVAGRHLPLPVVMATVFATWFGAEAVFGVSATFVQEGLTGVAADPFGSSMCLIIAGFFFSTQLYKLNILTLGDFYRMRYNRAVEILTTVAIVISYLGWVAAQIKALGLIFNIITDGAVSEEAGMILGTAIVLTYTTLGGMLSVAVLDFVQMIVVISGLLYIGSIVSGMTGGVAPVVEHARAAGKLDFFPNEANWGVWLTFLGGWMTMMLGSIPQQDVFQRITSAKSAKIALWGSILGASVYFCFTFVPMFIAYAATLIDPAVFGKASDRRLATRIAYFSTHAYASHRASHLFWRRIVGHHELLFRHPARTVRELRREHRQRLHASFVRQRVFKSNAHLLGWLCLHGVALCT